MAAEKAFRSVPWTAGSETERRGPTPALLFGEAALRAASFVLDPGTSQGFGAQVFEAYAPNGSAKLPTNSRRATDWLSTKCSF